LRRKVKVRHQSSSTSSIFGFWSSRAAFAPPTHGCLLAKQSHLFCQMRERERERESDRERERERKRDRPSRRRRIAPRGINHCPSPSLTLSLTLSLWLADDFAVDPLGFRFKFVNTLHPKPRNPISKPQIQKSWGMRSPRRVWACYRHPKPKSPNPNPQSLNPHSHPQPPHPHPETRT